ncbi:putative transcriptional regulator [Acinetobacter baumannii]|uniref:XRE family transcriptional regulator n=1 Tax=Acinetobacter baumannii TaxID=470 RepID=UPI0002B9AF81|nr:LexA family transcriptional regulator [Acinetobacter baumannii]EHT1073047.1 LexA family transcriptional regulator [Acinetobacter baumannii]EJB8489540.1 LexA family transcriptional regulator [Acinetobacter baumannii]EKV7756981.1 LexA family transcriptional regulator [Acinetobacter baumannii]EKW7507598.1 LexA family transcriptional regulator [Acinetobacter baumannii]EKW8718080.1 LexA family transcriptional regulator [Acinetobacter baumannii]
MALKDRLKDSRIKAKKTQAEVAEAVKMSQPAYQALESGKNLKSAFLPLIAQFLGVDAYWLTTGNSEDSFRESDVFSPTVVNNDAADQYVWIEVVEASFSCGTGESIEFHFDAINGKIPFPPSFFKEKRVAQECMRIIKAKGDSMTDYIKDGDLVGIDISQTEVIDGEIYAVYFAGEGMIKQIFKEADGSLILHSLNEKFRDRRVTEENGKNFKVMGRQFWRAG